MRRGRLPFALTLFVALALLLTPVSALAQEPAPAQPTDPAQPTGVELPAAYLPIVASSGAQQSFAVLFDEYTPVPADLQPAIEAAMRTAPGLRQEPYNVTSFTENEGWYAVYAVPLAVVQGGWETDYESSGSIELLGHKAEDGSAAFAVKGTDAYEHLAGIVPARVGVFGVQALLAAQAAAPDATAAADFALPWPASWAWEKWQGWHYGWEPYSIDFVPRDRPAVNQYDAVKMTVVAAAGGVVTRTCVDSYQTTLRIDTAYGSSNIRHHYLHLASDTVPPQMLNQSIGKGAYLGMTYNGSMHDYKYPQGSLYGTKCGYGDATHLHFALSTKDVNLQGVPADNVANSGYRSSWTSKTTLYCPTNYYTAKYYANNTASGTPTFQRCERSQINYRWGHGSPGYGLPNDNFSARWTGYAYFSPGVYVFKGTSDDGMYATLDNSTPIVKAYWDHGPSEFNLARSVGGGTHRFDIVYYERGGGASAAFRWVPLTPGVIYFGGFEGGRFNGWDESSTHNYDVVGQWPSYKIARPYSGSYSAWLGGDHNEVTTVSQTIVLPSNMNTRLYYYYDVGSSDAYGYDWAYIQVNGTTVKTHALWWGNTVTGYELGSVDLRAYKGRAVTITFKSTTDYSYVSSFALDHVQLGFYSTSDADTVVESDAAMNFEPAADDIQARTKPAITNGDPIDREPTDGVGPLSEPAAPEASQLAPWEIEALEAGGGEDGLQASSE